MTLQPLPSRPLRVLIAEDELPTQEVMRMSLQDRTKEESKKSSHLGPVSWSFAPDVQFTRRWLRTTPFDVVSLDMRMPNSAGDTVQTLSGTAFATSGVVTSVVAKALIYSAVVEVEAARDKPGEAMMIANTPVQDKYAKGGRSLAATDTYPYETLSSYDWAQRILDYMTERRLTFAPSGGSTRKSAVGAWLQAAPRQLPPVLARLAANLAQHWEQRDSTRVDAAHRFIEACARLAVAQTAVVLAAAGVAPSELMPPTAWQHVAALDTLELWRNKHSGKLSAWNWGNWLTPQTLLALQAVRKSRNERAHTLAHVNPGADWEAIYEPLRYAMDLAGYWALHPLCMWIDRTTDGTRSLILASTETPLPFRPLDEDCHMPDAAMRDEKQCWQPLWTCPGGGTPTESSEPPDWQAAPAHWGDWIRRDVSGGAWLKLWTRDGVSEWLDLVTGAREKK